MAEDYSRAPTLAFLSDLRLAGIEHAFEEPIEKHILDLEEDCVRQDAAMQRRIRDAQSIKDRELVVALKEEAADMKAEHPSSGLLKTAREIKEMREALDPETVALAMKSEQMDVCPTCGRFHEREYPSEFAKMLAETLGGECAACVGDRLKLSNPSAIEPIPVQEGDYRFGRGSKIRSATGAFAVVRGGGRRLAQVVPPQSVNTEGRARKAEEGAFGSRSLRNYQDAIDEARFRVRRFADAVHDWIECHAADAQRANEAIERAERAREREVRRAEKAKAVAEKAQKRAQHAKRVAKAQPREGAEA